MHILTINVHDRALDKIIYFLDNLPKQDIEIVSKQAKSKKIENDFISSLVDSPITVEKDLLFLSREEAHER